MLLLFWDVSVDVDAVDACKFDVEVCDKDDELLAADVEGSELCCC